MKISLHFDSWFRKDTDDKKTDPDMKKTKPADKKPDPDIQTNNQKPDALPEDEQQRYAEARELLRKYYYNHFFMRDDCISFSKFGIPSELEKQWFEEDFAESRAAFLKKCALGEPANYELGFVMFYCDRLTEDTLLELFHTIIDNVQHFDQKSERMFYVEFLHRLDKLNMAPFNLYYLCDVIRRRLCALYSERPELLDQLPKYSYYITVVDKLDSIPHGAEDLVRARQLWRGYHGDREAMRGAGVLEEYEGYRVAPRIEERWLRAEDATASEELHEEWIEEAIAKKHAAFLEKCALGEDAEDELEFILDWRERLPENMFLELFHVIADNAQHIHPFLECRYYKDFCFQLRRNCMSPSGSYEIYTGIMSRLDAIRTEHPELWQHQITREGRTNYSTIYYGTMKKLYAMMRESLDALCAEHPELRQQQKQKGGD